MSQEPKSEGHSRSNIKQFDHGAPAKSESATLKVSTKTKDQTSLPHSATLPTLASLDGRRRPIRRQIGVSSLSTSHLTNKSTVDVKFQELVLLKHKELPPNVSNKDSTTDKTLTGSSTKNVSTVTVLEEVDPQDLSDLPIEMGSRNDGSIDQLRSLQQENQWLKNSLSELKGENETLQVNQSQKSEQRFREKIRELDQKLGELELKLQQSQESEQRSKEIIKKQDQRIKELEKLGTDEANLEKVEQLKTEEDKLSIALNMATRIQKSLDQRCKQIDQVSLKLPQHQNIDSNSLNKYAIQSQQKLIFDEIIGRGSYGCVYDVALNGTHCIAKRLHDILMGQGGHEPVQVKDWETCYDKFFHDCVLMSKADHPNIVKFIGVQFGPEKFDLTLFMEKLADELQKYLESNPNIEFLVKVSILYDVSCGLLYLHEQCSIIHRDLTASNVLLTASNHAKIANLGVSRFVNRSFKEQIKFPGTLAYLPPEARTQSATYNESLDIFSMGVLALFTTIQEFPEFNWEHVPDAYHEKGEREIYLRRKSIAKCEEMLKPLILWCLSDDPANRPSTFCLNVSLREMKNHYEFSTI